MGFEARELGVRYVAFWGIDACASFEIYSNMLPSLHLDCLHLTVADSFGSPVLLPP